MTHFMRLHENPFNAMKAGYKTIELRLYDEKRQALKVGDSIVFQSNDSPNDTITKNIKALHTFTSFEELYSVLPLLSCGYTPFTLPYAKAEDMKAYYSKEEQDKFRVVGIELEAELLQRFIAGQTGAMEDCSGYDTALEEIRSGQKQTHWLWYVLPQIKGLTSDPVTEYYAITLEEAKAFLEHPLLGQRLIEITNALLDVEAYDLVSIVSMIDAFKIKASMTLFGRISENTPVFKKVLDKYCFGVEDNYTVQLIQNGNT